MATKIRRIYKGNNPIKIVEVEGLEPLYVVAVNSSGQESIVYAKNDYCTITITYHTTTLTYNTYKGKTLKSIVATLNESAITGAITGKDFLQWFIINNGETSSITPPSLDKTIDCLEDIVVNGDMSITGIYDTTQCTVQVYDYDHTTLVDTIIVDYGTTVLAALSTFDYTKLNSPDINLLDYTFMFNGWTSKKGSNLLDTDLLESTITGTISVYPVYTAEKITYDIQFYTYDPESESYVSIESILEIYYTESIKDAIARLGVNPLDNIYQTDFGDSLYVHNLNVLFYAKDTTASMTQDTLIKNIPSTYLKPTIHLYIGYEKIVKTYSVKLYDELSGTYIYQNTGIIHGTILENIQELSPIFNQIRNGEYHSTDEQEHYYYNYWLEYSDGTIYNENTLTTVTNNIELYIVHTVEPLLYIINFARGKTLDDYDEIDSINVNYDNYFSLSNRAKNYVATPIYEIGSTDNLITYSSTYQSILNSSRKLSGTATLKCIGDETFVSTEASRETVETEISIYIGSISDTLYTRKTLTSGTDYSITTLLREAFGYKKSTVSGEVVTNTSTDYILISATPHEYSQAKDYPAQKVTSESSSPITNTSGYAYITIIIITKETTETKKVTVTYRNADMSTTFWSTTVEYGTKYKDIPRPSGTPKDAGNDVFKWWSAGGTGLNIDNYPDSIVTSDIFIYPCYELSQAVDGNYPTSNGVHIYNPTTKRWTQLLDYDDTYFSSKTISATTDADKVIFTIYANGLILNNMAYAKVAAGTEVVSGTTSLGNGYWGLSGVLPGSSPSYITAYAEPVLYSHGPSDYTTVMTVTVYLKNGLFNDLDVGESATYDLSIRVPNGSGSYVSTDGYYYNSSSVKLTVTKTDKAQVGGGD